VTEELNGPSEGAAHPELVVAQRRIWEADNDLKLEVIQDEGLRLAPLVDNGEILKPDAVDTLSRGAENGGLYARFRRNDIEHVIGMSLNGVRSLSAPTDGHSEKSNGHSRAGGRHSEHSAPPATEPRIFSATDLQKMTFPPLNFILPGLVPEGATLLVSRPKLGKSWFVLDLALAIAGERFTLGNLKPASGAVLYLALEDGPRRLQRRVTRLLPTFSERWPSMLEMATEWPRAEQGLAKIDSWISKAQTPRLVIIDTLAQFRKESTGKSAYAEDYAAVAGLQKVASCHNVAIVIVHHDRKAEADDVFDTVSGTLGLSAAADTIMILKRQSGSVTLHIRGRDIEDAEKALQFNKTTCRWTIIGEASEFHRSEAHARILAVLADAPPEGLTVNEIMARADLKRATADKMLQRMNIDSLIQRRSRGKYSLPAQTTSIVSETSEVSEQSQPVEDTG
jgi:hypothetical protein